MKRPPLVLLGLLFVALSFPVAAQTPTAVTFKVFPSDYELFLAGDRQTYTLAGDGLRRYQLPAGSVRVSLTAPGAAPLSLNLDVKAGMPLVQAKLAPRTGPLTLAGEAATGPQPRSLAFSADGKKLYVALGGEAAIQVFDVPSLKEGTKLVPPSGGAGGFTDVIETGGEVWALRKDGVAHLFVPGAPAQKEEKALGGGGNAFWTALGSGRLALVDWDNLQVLGIEAQTRQVRSTLRIPGALRGFAVRNGTAYASLFDQGKVAVIDAGTWQIKALWAAGQAPRPVAAAGTYLFVGDMASAQVLVLDATTGQIKQRIGVASNPHQMAVSADQTLVAVASRGRNNPADYQLAGPEFGKVTLLDAQGQVLASVWGRNQPTGLAFSADGKWLAFTDYLDNNVELYRITPVR